MPPTSQNTFSKDFRILIEDAKLVAFESLMHVILLLLYMISCLNFKPLNLLIVWRIILLFKFNFLLIEKIKDKFSWLPLVKKYEFVIYFLNFFVLFKFTLIIFEKILLAFIILLKYFSFTFIYAKSFFDWFCTNLNFALT